MKRKLTYSISADFDLWWTSWSRGGWQKEMVAPCSTHAELNTMKQAFKCANQAIDRGASGVWVVMRDMGKGTQTEWRFTP